MDTLLINNTYTLNKQAEKIFYGSIFGVIFR